MRIDEWSEYMCQCQLLFLFLFLFIGGHSVQNYLDILMRPRSIVFELNKSFYVFFAFIRLFNFSNQSQI